MSWFNFGKKKGNDSKSKCIAEYVNSEHFRGTKKKKLVVYGSASAQAGIDALKIKNPAFKHDKSEPEYIFNLQDAKIAVHECRYDGNHKCYQIHVNGHHIGTIFDWDDQPALLTALKKGTASTVHIEIEQTTVIGKKRNKLIFTPTYEPYIFVK